MLNNNDLKTAMLESLTRISDAKLAEQQEFIKTSYTSNNLSWDDIITDRVFRRYIRSLETIQDEFSKLSSGDWARLGEAVVTLKNISFEQFYLNAPNEYKDVWMHAFIQTYSHNILHGGEAKRALTVLYYEYLHTGIMKVDGYNPFGMEDIFYVGKAHAFEMPLLNVPQNYTFILLSSYEYLIVWPEFNGKLLLENEDGSQRSYSAIEMSPKLPKLSI